MRSTTDEESGAEQSDRAVIAKIRRLPGIHGLRAIAALGILAVHVRYISNPILAVPSLIEPSLSNAVICVHLFFILSVFSILYSYESSPSGSRWIALYATRRMFRIAPLFYAMIVYNYGHFITKIPFRTLLYNVLFIFNFVPGEHYSVVWAGWTIGVEMPVYVLLPFAIAKVRTLNQAVLLAIGATIVSVAARIIFARMAPDSDYPYMSFLGNLSVFSLGVVAYRVSKTFQQRFAFLPIARAISLLGLIVFVSHHGSDAAFGPRLDILLWSIPLATLCMWQAQAPSRILSCGPMQWIGERSFSIYLLHPFVVYRLASAGAYDSLYSEFSAIGDWAYVVSVAVTIALALALAAITYFLIETPGQKLGALLIRSLGLAEKKRLTASTAVG